MHYTYVMYDGIGGNQRDVDRARSQARAKKAPKTG
jgi:hypothetical protein